MEEERGRRQVAAGREALDPGIFAHGRLLRRYPGSDAHRFSSRLALGILDHVQTDPDRAPHVLWDPFCGTGLIPCVALFAYPDKFDAVIASDVDPDAVRCARLNMGILSAPETFERHLREVHGRRGANPKEDRRWGEVERYMERIRPIVGAQREVLPATRTVRAGALDLPRDVSGRVHFVADLPYGNTSTLRGGGLHEVIPAVRRAYPECTFAFVVGGESVGELLRKCPGGLRCRPLKGGRVLVRG
ncbi:MAG: hypothetical protein R6X33_10695 [Candidatus Brocadiia bacterium]